MNKQTKNWVQSVLMNDEESNDQQLIDYFMHGGIDRETAIEIVRQREEALNNLNFELDI